MKEQGWSWMEKIETDCKRRTYAKLTFQDAQTRPSTLSAPDEELTRNVSFTTSLWLLPFID